MKYSKIILLFLFLINSCTQNSSENESASQAISIIFEDYYKFKEKINPLEATKAGNFEYNDYIANYISDEYQKELIVEYQNFLSTYSIISH